MTIKWTTEDYEAMLPHAVEAQLKYPQLSVDQCFLSAQNYVMPQSKIKTKESRTPKHIKDKFWIKWLDEKMKSPGPLFEIEVEEEPPVQDMPNALKVIGDSIAELDKKVHGLLGLYSKADQIIKNLEKGNRSQINILIVDSAISPHVLGTSITGLQRVGCNCVVISRSTFTTAAIKTSAKFLESMKKYHLVILPSSAIYGSVQKMDCLFYIYDSVMGFEAFISEAHTFVKVVNRINS